MKIVYKHAITATDRIGVDGLIDIILKNRKIKDIKTFLKPENPLGLNLADFGFKKELNKTLKLLEDLKKNQKMIVVYTDYDADGITGGAILWETLHLLGFKAIPYVPHRKQEGYGFSIKGIDNVKKLHNPALIISVDHGITAREKVTYAKKLGIPIIITDHHLKPEKLPDDAVAIFHEPQLSGSGVAYFFAKAVFDHFKSDSSSKVSHLKSHFESDYLCLASVGTIADLVPLVGPSRSVVSAGLECFPKMQRVGIKHILKESGIDGKKITPYEVGFIIAPRINAVGRLEHAIDALRLLCTTNDGRAYALASRVGDTNRQRQDMVEKSVKQAKAMVEKLNPSSPTFPNVLILKNKDWHEGIIGLIASKVVEEYYRPTIVMTESNGFLKGSARSILGFHITNFLRNNKKFLIDVGGHTGAAGFTMNKEQLEQFVISLEKQAKKVLTEEDLERKTEVDMKLPLSYATIQLAQRLEKLEPFGIGNPRPSFMSEVEIMQVNLFGKTKDHVKLYVKDDSQPFPFELISFYSAKKMNNLTKGQKAKIVYNIDIDRWGGNEKLRGRIIELQAQN